MTESTSQATPTNPGRIIAVLASAGILVSLAQTLIIPLIVELPAMFDASPADASWVVTSTLLAGAVATPIMGRLADMYDKKLMLLIAIAAFVAGSVACALADDLTMMIAGRALQGVASGMIPLGISILHELLPVHQAGAAIALMSSSMGIGGALGLPLSAAIAQFADWRILFWAVGAAALLVGIAITVFIHPPKQAKTRAKFDLTGAIGLGIGLIALLLAISKGADWGWASLNTIGLFVIAIVVLVSWGWFELRRTHPLINIRTTMLPTVLFTNLVSVLFGFSMYAMNLVVPQIMQLPVELGYGLGQSMVMMGLWMMPLGIGMMAVAKWGAEISRTRGPRVTLIIAGIVIAAGYGIIAVVLATLGNREAGPASTVVLVSTLILFSLGGAVSGCGIGLAFGAMPALIMSTVPAADIAAANGFNALMRSLGTSSAAAIVGMILASTARDFSGSQVPSMTGLLVSLIVAVCVAAGASALSVAIPRRR